MGVYPETKSENLEQVAWSYVSYTLHILYIFITYLCVCIYIDSILKMLYASS